MSSRRRIPSLRVANSEFEQARLHAIFQEAARQGHPLGYAYRGAIGYRFYKQYVALGGALAWGAYKKASEKLHSMGLNDLFTPPSKKPRLRGGFVTPLAITERGEPAPSYRDRRWDMSFGTYNNFVGPIPRNPSRPKFSAVTRFHGGKVLQKGFIKNYRYKKQKRVTPRDLVNAMYPIVRWSMIGPSPVPADFITSDIGKQKVLSDDAARDFLFKRSDLKLVYNKLFIDGMLTPQVNDQYGVEGSNHIGVLKNNDPTTNDIYKPSLQFLSYHRTYTITNRKDSVCYIECWECLSKDYQSGDFAQHWTNSLTQATEGATRVDGVYGLAAMHKNSQDPTTNQTRAITDPGLSPWKNLKLLWKDWKILRRTKYRLEPGAHIDHVVHVPGFNLSHSTLYDQDHTTENIKDLTLNMCWKVIGERCYDNSVTGTAKLSYMPAEISIEYNDTMVIRMRPRLRKSFRFTTNHFAAFDSAFDSANAVPQALAPTVAMPSFSMVHENYHDKLVNDGEYTAGTENVTTATGLDAPET